MGTKITDIADKLGIQPKYFADLVFTCTRAHYMDGEADHSEYYNQYAECEHIKKLTKKWFGNTIVDLKEPDMSAIPLSSWDQLGYAIIHSPANHEFNKIMESNGDFVTSAGLVCIFKQAGRNLWNEYNGGE